MSTARVPISTEEPDATPRVDGRRTPLQQADPALRLVRGRFTVDIVDVDGQLVAMVGEGVGTEPESVAITPAAVAVLVATADRVDERAVWATQAWPLAC